jgi:hypothetical protein
MPEWAVTEALCGLDGLMLIRHMQDGTSGAILQPDTHADLSQPVGTVPLLAVLLHWHALCVWHRPQLMDCATVGYGQWASCRTLVGAPLGWSCRLQLQSALYSCCAGQKPDCQGLRNGL